MTPEEIELSDVSHRFGRRQSIAHASLRLPIGITGLLGPNGAGKSTMIKLLATALPLQEGSIRFGSIPLCRSNIDPIRRMVGYLPQRFELMNWASVGRNIEYAAWAQGVSQTGLKAATSRIAHLVDLEDKLRSRARDLSGGMRQRLGLACTLVHEPHVVLLDEPTVGLDPAQRAHLRSMILEAGRTSIILISTHLIEDLANIAHNVVILSEGQVKFTGALADLYNLGRGHETEHSTPLEAGYHAALTLGD